ncbi:hypothetical protein PT273_05650 [Orbaceae bacterium ESL0727]|nr:hypothetical protein [Orbaceae bacterium ESL0727]
MSKRIKLKRDADKWGDSDGVNSVGTTRVVSIAFFVECNTDELNYFCFIGFANK